MNPHDRRQQTTTSGAALAEGTGLALILREVDGGAGVEGDAHLIGTADGASIPVERKGGLGVAIAVMNRPGLTVDSQILGTITHQITDRVPRSRWISRSLMSCCARSAIRSVVVLASGALAAVIP